MFTACPLIHRHPSQVDCKITPNPTADDGFDYGGPHVECELDYNLKAVW